MPNSCHCGATQGWPLAECAVGHCGQHMCADHEIQCQYCDKHCCPQHCEPSLDGKHVICHGCVYEYLRSRGTDNELDPPEIAAEVLELMVLAFALAELETRELCKHLEAGWSLEQARLAMVTDEGRIN